MEKVSYRFNQQTVNERTIPTSITSEGEQLFIELFGIPFQEAKELATWEGEIGEHFRNLFQYIHDYRTPQNSGTDLCEHGGG